MSDEVTPEMIKAGHAAAWARSRVVDCEDLNDIYLAMQSARPAEPRVEALEEVLRGLASTLGAGGYNAETVDPDVFDRKIRWGIDNLVNMTIQRCADVVEEQSKTYARNSYGDCKRAVLDLKLPEEPTLASPPPVTMDEALLEEMRFLAENMGDDLPVQMPAATFKKLHAAIAALSRSDPRLAEAARLLTEWQAVVRGECPSLIDDDSGGDGGLDLDTDRLLAVLKEGASRG